MEGFVEPAESSDFSTNIFHIQAVYTVLGMCSGSTATGTLVKMAGREETLSTILCTRHSMVGGSCRQAHTATAVGRRIYIIGGMSLVNFQEQDTVIFVEMNGSTWTQKRLEGENANGFEPKSSHSCSLVGDKLYVIGGYLDEEGSGVVYVFDVVLNSWTQQSFYGEPHNMLYRHAAEYMEKFDQIVCFGGGTSGYWFSNQATALDMSSLCWVALKVKGEIPEARDRCASYADGSTFYMFGGNTQRTIKSDLWVLRFSRKLSATWSKIISNHVPREREGGRFVLFHGKLLLYGGTSSSDFIGMDIFDPRKLEWIQFDHESLTDDPQIRFSGNIPSSRRYHTMTNVLGNTIMIYGGSGNNDEIRGAIYTLEKLD